MKKFFVITFIALFVAAASYAQENVFIINGEKIENFDGSQLTGKKILSFNVIKNEKVIFIMYILTTYCLIV